ncbi:MAG: class I SAM-dependent methyltransferase [Lentisphaeria bacterium]|nr:class I SAM-dependent methyltransferase [Lentisphaeria bacterium]
MAYLDIAKMYDQIFLFSQTKIDFLSQYLPTDGSVLDFGCGTGKMTDILNQAQRPVYGIDIDSSMITEAKRLRPNTHFTEASMTQLDLCPLQPQAAFCVGNTLSYLNHEALTQFLKNLYHALPENGIWIFQTLNWNFILNQNKDYQFPDLEVKEQQEPQIFRRWYDQITSEHLQFHRQVIKNDQIVSDEFDTLYPQTSENYDQLHQAIGFKLVGSFANFKGDPLNPSQDSASIKVFRK